MKSKFLKFGLGATIASVIAAGIYVSAAPALAQSTAPSTSGTQSLQQGRGGLQSGRGGRMGHMGGRGMHLTEVAKVLNMTEADLKTELEAGKSVAEIAAAKGVSVDTIVSAIITAETERLAQAVTDGKFTQAQADTLLANLKLTLPSQLRCPYSAR